MSDHPFVDNEGEPLADYNALKEYQMKNYVAPIIDEILHTDEAGEFKILITTKQSGLVHAFKTVVSCEEGLAVELGS